jgi:hypothetical protein
VVPLTDADAIFAKTRAAYTAGAYPHYAEYDVRVDYRNGGNRVHRTWITTEDLRHGLVTSRIFSREETADPGPPPTGINISIPLLAGALRHRDPEPVGQLALAITQDFDLNDHHLQLGYHPPSLLSDYETRLTVIGTTKSKGNAPLYAVRLLDTAPRGDDDVIYHLGLTPNIDPWRHRLRELWVDGKTMLPTQAIVSAIGNRAPLTSVHWHVTFAEIEGATYLANMNALATLDYGRDGQMEDTTITFQALRLSSRPSDPLALDIGTGADPSTVQSEP